MAAQQARPGVEIIQEFQSTSPTIVTPQLVPCNVAPFFEIIDVLKADGTANDDAKMSDIYRQLALVIPQASFPSPRGNIDEVDVLEDSIRFFFSFGGRLIELSRSSGFLTSLNIATQPFITGTGTGPFNLDGTTIVIQMDSHLLVANGGTVPNAAHLPASANIPITFVGNSLAIADVIAQIEAIIPGIASNSSGNLRLTSTKLGAGASMVVQPTGSANTALGFSVVSATLAVGAGFFAPDDGDGDLLSPRIEMFLGSTQRLSTASNVPSASAVNFTDANIRTGDTITADGVLIGDVDVVFSDRLVMELEQPIFGADAEFSPRYFWVQGNNLSFPPSGSTAGVQTGSVATTAASAAFIVSSAVFVAVGAGESFNIDVAIDGVAQPTEVVGSGAGFVSLAAAITAINAVAVNFQAYPANIFGDEVATALAQRIGLRTLASNTGSGAAITLAAQSAGMANLGFSGLPVSDVGENIRYLPGTQPRSVEASGFVACVATQSITYTPTINGAAQAAETVTWAASHATIGAAISDWNSQTRFSLAYEGNAAGVPTSGGARFCITTRGTEENGTDTSFNVTATDAAAHLPLGIVSGTDVDLNNENFQWSLDLNPLVHNVLFVADEDDGSTSLQSVIDKINDETPGVASASPASPPALRLTSTIVGEASQVRIENGTSNPFLGFTDDATNNGNGRPNPDLAIDIDGAANLQAQQLRDPLTGLPFPTSTAPIYVQYKALRLDVTPDADNPALLTITDTAQLEEVAGPINTDNPGAAMTFMTLINSPGTAVAAIGVPQISDDAPEGTPIGYARCFSFLESEEVYALSIGTQLEVIHQAAITHANFMSQPANKGERIVFVNPPVPDRDLPTLIASGTDANTTPTPGRITVDVNLAPGLLEQGLDPGNINPTTGPIENEVYLDLGTDDNIYLIQRVENGVDVYLRNTFDTGDGNEDAFFATSFPSGVISADWTVAIRGDQLLVPGTDDPDKDRIALTVQKKGQAYGFRRLFYVFPDQVGINITGLEQVVPGYYATSAIVGMVGNLPPQQGFTNFPIVGLTQVIGSNKTYSNSQLSVMAAGGIYILIQDAIGAPVIARHQLSTDMSSIETRELSITKVVDFTAKFIRAGIRSFIGRVNITQAFIDQLSSVLEGLLEFLKQTGVLIGSSVNNVLQDADNPDTVLVDITLDVPFPCNFIRVTLVI